MFLRNVGELLPDYMASYGAFRSHCHEIFKSQIMSVIVLYVFCEDVITFFSSEIHLQTLIRPMHIYALRKLNMSHTESEMPSVTPVLILLYQLLHLHVRYQTADLTTAYCM
jgi:hypothetical protein